MSIVTTGNIPKALEPGVRKFFGHGYKEHPLERSDLFDVEGSSKAREEDVLMTGLGMVPESSEGKAVTYDSISQGWTATYRNLVYKLGFIVTREAIDDDQYNLAFKKAQFLGMSVRQTQETTGANVYNRAFNAAYLGGDGKEMCATDHPLKGGGTFSNELATAADFSQAALEQALIDIAGFVDDRGLKIAAKGVKLIGPKELMHEFERVLKTGQALGNNNNDVNPVANAMTSCINHYLTDADAWFIRTDVPDGARCFERVKPEFKKDGDFDTENAKFKTYFRESYGWTDPRGIFGSPGAA